MVTGVTWQPYYDLHASTSDGKPLSDVSLHYCANITQSTGEDWTNTILTLSTANSHALHSLTVPKVDPLRLLPARSGGGVFGGGPVQQQQALVNITLNEKNLYSLRVLLNIAMFLSSVLGSSWYLVLETLQLADFLLFNRPVPKGSSNTPVTGSANNLRRTMTNSSVASANQSPGLTSRK